MLGLNGSSRSTFLMVAAAKFAVLSLGAAPTSAVPISYTFTLETPLQAEAVLEGDLVTGQWESSGPGSDLETFEIVATSPNNFWTTKILLTRTPFDEFNVKPFSYSIVEIFGQHITAPHPGESEKGPELTIGKRGTGQNPVPGSVPAYEDLGDALDLPAARLNRGIMTRSGVHPGPGERPHVDWMWSAFDRNKRTLRDVLDDPDDTIRLRVFLEHNEGGQPKRLRRLPEPGSLILFGFGVACMVLLGTTSRRFKKNFGV
ncbi:PEP-CTERM sorting domain-containing protein [Pelagibius sp. Alg239-R121]|uniref:PEP-CTERM sorting domain-containing protein n=1 Tax=Pelagibius sp. Alg239-R121 TaxID=2993448 RepID=UPI0024A78991|nr:PEP-CTERM sorting domain-containing protein [Pelagibius sp. Alg239-R121]